MYARPQHRAAALLNVQPGERVFVPGVGTGMGMAALPAGVQITAIDLSPAMLAQAQRKLAGRAVTFEVMDAQDLHFPDGSFDAALLSLILSVVPDGAAAFREAWRVLRPGGRAVIFDKFLSETGRLSPLRRAVGALMRAIGADPNRRHAAHQPRDDCGAGRPEGDAGLGQGGERRWWCRPVFGAPAGGRSGCAVRVVPRARRDVACGRCLGVGGRLWRSAV